MRLWRLGHLTAKTLLNSILGRLLEDSGPFQSNSLTKTARPSRLASQLLAPDSPTRPKPQASTSPPRGSELQSTQDAISNPILSP